MAARRGHNEGTIYARKGKDGNESIAKLFHFTTWSGTLMPSAAGATN